MFIGYPRSGHSLIAALLDAHPEVVMGMEWGVLPHLGMGYNKNQIIYSLVNNSRQFRKKENNTWTGYSYRVEGQWQGRYQQIRVIGDKLGGRTSLLIQEDPSVIERMKKSLGYPIKWIHVIRNPFDIITTMTRRRLEKQNAWTENADPEELLPSISAFFNRVEAVNGFRGKSQHEIIDVYHEDFIACPEKELTKLINFLGLEASSDYLSSCAAIVYDKPHRSRELIRWTPELIQQVEEKIKLYGFLQRYSFYS
ncbi:MAG: sulfotransferase family protein [Bacteroidales bacterium]|jgi:hypothetical protein